MAAIEGVCVHKRGGLSFLRPLFFVTSILSPFDVCLPAVDIELWIHGNSPIAFSRSYTSDFKD